MTWARVYTVNDYDDVPRLGVAEYRGQPHIYESPFDESLDGYPEHYYVVPVESDLLELILKEWRIWEKWKAAFQAGDVDLDSHPALPEDVDAHESIHMAIADRFNAEDPSAMKLWARFRTSTTGPESLEVQWFESELAYQNTCR